MIKLKNFSSLHLACMVVLLICWLLVPSKYAKGLGSDASLFVRGQYAFVLYKTGSNGSELYIMRINSPESVGICTSITLQANWGEVFVAGDYMYVVNENYMFKYDITNPCSPESVGFSGGPGAITDLYVTNNMAYVSYDPSGVFVYDVSADSLVILTIWGSGSGSPQGLHVRGGYGYVANEFEPLWVRDIPASTDYKVGTGSYGRDAYNIGFRKDQSTAVSVTYLALDNSLQAWDTTDPQDIFLLGSSLNPSSSVDRVVHVTGDWVYFLGNDFKVDVYSVGYSAPQFHNSLSAPYSVGSLEDMHIVHTGYWGKGKVPTYGAAHIFGAWVDTSADPDTVALYIWNPSSDSLPVKGYRYGDVDEDGDVDLSDALCIHNYTLLGYNDAVSNLDAADVNCDGEVNTYDRDYLMKFLFQGGDTPGADCAFYKNW